MRSSGKSLAGLPTDNSAAAPHGRAAAASLDQDDSGATNGPENGARAAATASDGASRLSDRLAALADLSLGDLRLEWRGLFRADPPRLSRDIIIRAIAYRLQEIAYGGASKATQRLLATFATEFETGGTIAPPPGPKIKPGSRLVREWHGRTHTVCVTDVGFEFQGKTYRSLTKIAFDITGAQWSGPRCFGLTKRAATATASADNLLISAEMISENLNG
jgi:hypothetical protein